MNRGFEEVKPQRVRAHSLSIDNRERMTLTGVNDVESFNELEILLATDAGILTITGEGLHISKLNLDDGQLMLEGLISGVEYSDHDAQHAKTGFFSRMFR